MPFAKYKFWAWFVGDNVGKEVILRLCNPRFSDNQKDSPTPGQTACGKNWVWRRKSGNPPPQDSMQDALIIMQRHQLNST